MPYEIVLVYLENAIKKTDIFNTYFTEDIVTQMIKRRQPNMKMDQASISMLAYLIFKLPLGY